MENEICVKEVIVSLIGRRGIGTFLSPVRRITQVFEKDGTLIAEKDPCRDDYFVAFDLINFVNYCLKNQINLPQIKDVEKWAESLKTTNSITP